MRLLSLPPKTKSLVMKLFFGMLVIFSLILSCKQKPGESTSMSVTEDEVMKIHDEVMPKITDINRLSSQLRDIKNKAGQTPEGTPMVIEGLDETLHDLRNAEQGMMDWMKNYSDKKAELSPEQLEMFYKEELEKIKAVRDSMLSSIENANAWLAAHPAG
jgi:hypothetical protein